MWLGQIKKIPVFRVTRPYLNLLVKPRNFFRYSGKNIILCILKGEMPFKIHKIIFFSRKKIIKNKYVCLLNLNFSDLLPETHIFYLALLKITILVEEPSGSLKPLCCVLEQGTLSSLLSTISTRCLLQKLADLDLHYIQSECALHLPSSEIG